MPTISEVLRAFDSFGDKYVQNMALQSRLEQEGFSCTDVAKALEAAIKQGDLLMNHTGGISRS